MTGRFFGLQLPPILLSILTDTGGYDIFEQAGSPAVRAIVVVTVASGVNVYLMSTGTGWVPGSEIYINNYGRIHGGGGHGGRGANQDGTGGVAGGAGSDAFSIWADLSIWINNGSGQIFGGGGGGGGGDGYHSPIYQVGGGGGGGGFPEGQPGVGGTGTTDGGDGEQCSENGPGAGGSGWGIAGNGGYGGNWGQNGQSGQHVSSGAGKTAGGAKGKAVALHGYTAPVWLSGNDSTHVKGGIA